MLNIIVSSSKCKYQEWQLRLLDWSIRKVRQKARLIILLSEDHAHKHEDAKFDFGSDVEVIELPDWAQRWQEEHDDWWGGIPNKYESFNWLAQYYPFNDSDILLFLDPDMIFIDRINLLPKTNQIIGQRWMRYQPLKGWPQKADAFMYPFALEFSTLKRIKDDFKEYCFRIRKEIGKWESDMWALDYAADNNGVDVEYVNRLGVCTPWPENDALPPSPIIHFPNIIGSNKGKKLFFKQDYTFQPDQEIHIKATRNATDRKLLINISQERTDYIYHIKWNFIDIFKWYSGENGSIILKPWPGGFNNIRMSLELSVCLAYLTNRTLVLPAAYEMYLLNGSSSFSDFFDTENLGVKVLKFEDFCKQNDWEPHEDVVRKHSKVIDYDSVGNVLNFEKMLVPEWFKKGRSVQTANEIFDSSKHLFLDGKLLGAFYQSIYTSFNEELKKLIAKHVVYRNDIFDLGWEFINYLGDQTYYAIHIRRNDFQYKDLFISCKDILEHLKGIVPQYSTLYIATDHNEIEFFAPLKEYYSILFYDDIVKRLKRSPQNPNWIPIIEQLICTRALKFVGMKLSTLSSYIYRLRGYMDDIEDKHYYLNGEPFSKEYQCDFRQERRFIANWAREYKCSWHFQKPSIFVSIASYCDTQLEKTIENAIEEAADISRIVFGVHLQDTEQTYHALLSKNYPNLRVKFTSEEKSKGVVWARNCIKRELYQNEDYFLQIDAHSRFKRNWDNILVNQHISLEIPRAVITTYPNHYEISDEEKKYLENTTNSPLVIGKFLTDYWEENRLRPRNAGPLKDYEIKECKWCAAGFVFAPRRWVKQIVLPDEIIFNGEEDLMTHLSYLHGFNLRTPSEAVVWHNYNYKNEKTGERYKEFNKHLKGDNSMRIVNDRLFGYTYYRSFESLQNYLNWEFRYLHGYASIFVTIAAYLDGDIRNTIKSCFQNARYPDKIRLGVCWQYDNATIANEGYLDDLVKEYPIDIVKFPCWESEGVGWAREKATRLYHNEKYCLQIDAHSRFAKDWDVSIIDNYRKLKRISEKPLLSCLPPGFSLANDGTHDFESRDAMDLVQLPEIFGITEEFLFDYLEKPANTTNGRSQTIPTVEPAFIFAEGHWARDVLPEPELYYLGEDLVTTIKSYIAGYDLFAPEQNILWHRTSRTDTFKHYNTHDLPKIRELNNRSMRLIKDLVTQTSGVSLQKQDRSISDYEQYANIDFHNKLVHPFPKRTYLFNKEPLTLGLITRCSGEFFIEEFCYYYLSQGVDEIHVIDDDSTDKSIYDNIRNHDQIIIHFEKNIVRRRLTDKLYKEIGHNFEWMIHVDCDEFITTKRNKEKTIREELESHFKHVDCLKVPWVMMSPNGRMKSPKSILKEITHRWNHNKVHINEVSNHPKFRCRYEKIEAKSIFKTKQFATIWDHNPGDPKKKKPIIVDSISRKPATLGPYYSNLREEDIRKGWLLCYHYRHISVADCEKKLSSSIMYTKYNLEDLLSNDYPEVLDETLKTKALLMELTVGEESKQQIKG